MAEDNVGFSSQRFCRPLRTGDRYEGKRTRVQDHPDVDGKGISCGKTLASDLVNR